MPTPAKLLVAIPCLNEESTIADVISDIPKLIPHIDVIDILVVDDGSSDSTRAKAEAAGAKVLSHSRNLGVGTAFRSAVNYAVEGEYDFMVNLDGDRQFNPADIPLLLAPLLDGDADMVTGSRFLKADYMPVMPQVKKYGNFLMSFLISKLVGQRFADVSCGFRAYSRESLLNLNLHGAFTYTQETFLDFAYKRLEIIEVPVKVVYFPDRKSRVAGSIIQYAKNTAKIIFRGYRDYFPLRFFWGIALIFFIPSVLFGSIFFGNYFLNGFFTGYLYAGFLSAFLLIMATVFFVLGVVTDMLDRIRSNQERVLYFLKKNNSNQDPS